MELDRATEALLLRAAKDRRAVRRAEALREAARTAGLRPDTAVRDAVANSAGTLARGAADSAGVLARGAAAAAVAGAIIVQSGAAAHAATSDPPVDPGRATPPPSTPLTDAVEDVVDEVEEDVADEIGEEVVEEVEAPVDPPPDQGPPADAGPPPDAGAPADAGPPPDAGPVDEVAEDVDEPVEDAAAPVEEAAEDAAAPDVEPAAQVTAAPVEEAAQEATADATEAADEVADAPAEAAAEETPADIPRPTPTITMTPDPPSAPPPPPAAASAPEQLDLKEEPALALPTAPAWPASTVGQPVAATAAQRALAAGALPVTAARVGRWVQAVEAAAQIPGAVDLVALPEVSPEPVLGWSYEVRAGDSLWSISERLWAAGAPGVGDLDATWRTLYRWNAGVLGTDPDMIPVGVVLEIPADGGAVTTT